MCQLISSELVSNSFTASTALALNSVVAAICIITYKM